MAKKYRMILLVAFIAFVVFFDPYKIRITFTLPTCINFLMLALFYIGISKYREKLTGTILSKAETFWAIVLGFCMTLGYGLIRGSGFGVFYGSILAVVKSQSG